MRCQLVGLCCLALLLSGPPAWGQVSGNAGAATVADKQPVENVRGGAVYQRAPGRIIDQARARHTALANQRLGAQRSGETWLLAPESVATGGFADSLSDLFGGSISNLIGTFLNSGLGGSIGSLTGGSAIPLNSGGGTSGGSSGSDFSNLPPEVLQMLANAGIDINDLKNANRKSKEDSAAASALSPKTSLRTQAVIPDTSERKFVVRWADAMLSTVFTAVTVALQTQDFIGLLKDAFRPIFGLPNSDTTEAARTATDAETRTNQDSDATGDSGDSADDSGDSSDDDPLI